jgi:hypothetical protein
MSEATADGAAAAAGYYLSLYQYIYATGDLTEWTALSAPSCEFCTKVSAEVTEIHSRGAHVISPMRVTSTEGVELDAARWYTAHVGLSFDESQEVASDGSTVLKDPAGDYSMTLAMTWADGWIIDAVGLDSRPS